MPRERLAIMVLGMHRSGTSATTRVLNLLGCDLPKALMPARNGNDAGHWESDAVCAFNDQVLADIGSGWDDWLPISRTWETMPRYDEDMVAAVALLRQEFGQSALFAFKDPRLCRMASFWIEAVERYGAQPRFVIPIRNPMEVAASLETRNGIPSAYGLLLWLRHALDAERVSRGRQRFYLSYAALLDDWQSLVSKMEGHLHIDFPIGKEEVSSEISGFLRRDLRHYVDSDASFLNNPGLAAWIRKVYAILLRWSDGGESSDDYAELDLVSSHLIEAAPIFAGLVQAWRDGASSEENIKLAQDDPSGMEAQRQLIVAQEASLQALHDQLMRGESQLTELRAKVASASEERRVLEERSEWMSGEHFRQLSGLTAQFDARQIEMAAERDALVKCFDVERAELSAQVTSLTTQVALLESNLVQRREEIEQTLNRLRHEEERSRLSEQALAQSEVALRAERARSEQLSKQLAQSEGWVFKLAGERREAEKDMRQLVRKVQAVERKLSETERRLVVAQFDLDVARVQTMTASVTTPDLAEKLEKAEADVARLKADMAEKEERIVSLTSARMDIDRKLNERFSEVAQVTSLLRQNEVVAKASVETISWLQAVHAVMTSRPMMAGLMPDVWLKKWRYDKLKSKNLFNAEGYLALYGDVASENFDPLRHYILHGISEGRSRGF